MSAMRKLTRSVWIEPVLVPFMLALVIAVGLYVDERVQPWGQNAVNLLVGATYVWLLLRSDGPTRTGLLVCLAIASVGECFCSLFWGLYTYRLHNVPLFVPPGHALLYTVGVALARGLPRAIMTVVPAIALPYIVFALTRGFATFDVLLYLVFLLCLWRGSAKKLYATMFMLSLLMEIYGTWLGNWRWWPVVPGLGLTSINPPLAAGAFYCVLDLLVVASVHRLERWRVVRAAKRRVLPALPASPAGRTFTRRAILLSSGRWRSESTQTSVAPGTASYE
jgi:hypothetical protein